MLVDLRHLVRSLRRSPASAIAAVLTLSLTLGAGASIFAVVDAVLFTPPPFANPDALVQIAETPIDDATSTPRALTYATFVAWRERAAGLATLEASDGTNLTLTDLGAAERLGSVDATAGFLPLLGVNAALGRGFVESEMGSPVAMISDAFWRGKLASDPAVIGRQLTLGGRRHTIVGVLPKNFVSGLSRSDLWRPLQVTQAQAITSGVRVGVVARLHANVRAEDLAALLDDVSRLSLPPSRAVVTPIARALVGDDAPRTLGLLAGAATLAMLIAFINLAGLLVVRSIDRRRELAVRSALGANRFEIAKQLLLEAQALVVLGTIGGVLLALWITPAAGRLASQVAPIAPVDIAVSWRVIVLVSVLASALAWICGLVPAFAAARRNIVDVLRRGATRQPSDLLLRRAFVAGEIALAFVLLVSVTLLGRSLIYVLKMAPGFDAKGVVVLKVSLPAANYPNGERIASFYAALQRQLQERLGPHAVSIVDELPLTGDRGRRVVASRPGERGPEGVVRSAAPEYFDVMRIPVVAGRGFTQDDNASATPRVVLSESLAQRLFPSGAPVGRRVWLGPAAAAPSADVIGVVGDVKHRALDENLAPTVYVSSLQAPSNSSIIVVRSALADGDVINAVRDEVGRLDRSLPVYGTASMQDVVARSPGVPARRVLTATFTGFALLGIVLGGIGLFGVLAHDVASRRSELALRVALGADPMRMLRATARQGALILGSGLAIGAVLSIWASRVLGGLVVATGDLDLLTIGAPSVVLLVAGAIAVLPAARRAAQTDPLAALRSE